MALWDRISTILAIQPTFDSIETLHVRNIPDMDMGSSTVSDLLLRSQGIRNQSWRAASIREAMGTPAIFRAVSLISNTTGSLAMETFRNGAKMPDDQTPSLVKRPDPYRTQRAFYRDCGYHLATRGELWWWIAKRDGDGLPLSLIIMPPWEVTVDNGNDRLRPTIKWLDREIPRENVRLITFMPDERSPAGPFQRGVGPLQLCGAAVSVAVESTEWAANFYAGGGRPPLIIQATGELGQNPDFANAQSEAEALRAQWMDQDANTPRVIDEGIKEITYPPESGQGGQMLDARNNENGNAARMYGIPGSLLEYQQSGSSLTYQNLEGEFTKFVKVCLAPGYLEPVEQEMSDLLTRSTVSRFNVRGFTRADQKTRWETYQIMVAVLGAEEAATVAREQEGLIPGDVEFAPVPFSPPAAVPDSLPIQRAASRDDTIHDWRCSKCNRKLADVAGPGSVQTCTNTKCKTVNTVPVVEARAEDVQPQIVISPTIHTPSPPPMVVNLAIPDVETRIVDVREQMTALGENMVDLSQYVERLSSDQESLGSRISGLAESQDGLVDRLNQPPKARTFVPIRDENGVIVSVTEAAS
jgi:HK97 family phage portal protein